jgi:hypothetical protein
MRVVLLWCVLCGACCVRAYLQPQRNTVFGIYRAAALAWIAGEDAYETASPNIGPYRYAPVVTVVLLPFSLLPLDLGGLVWRLFNVLGLMGAFAWFLRDGLPWRNEKASAALWLLLMPLSLGSINNGQANVLLLALLLATGAALAGERWNLAAACLAGAVLLKVYPLAVALLLVLVYPRPLLGRFAIALAAGLLAPFAFQTPSYVLHAYENWFVLLASDDRRDFLMHEGLRDFHLLSRLVGWPLPTRIYLAIQLLAGLSCAAIGIYGRARKLPERQQVWTMLTLGCCWMVVFGPAVESSTFILIAPALAWAIVESWTMEGTFWRRIVLGGVLALFVVSFMSLWFPLSRNWLYFLQPLAALLFFGERITEAVATRRTTL